MTTLIGISVSLRRGSYNTALLRAAADLMPDGARLRIGTICSIPLYDGDLKAARGCGDALSRSPQGVFLRHRTSWLASLR
jgi:chromate reductase, NAD(P)H dehydrogenase (quinone)